MTTGQGPLLKLKVCHAAWKTLQELWRSEYLSNNCQMVSLRRQAIVTKQQEKITIEYYGTREKDRFLLKLVIFNCQCFCLSGGFTVGNTKWAKV